MIDFDSNESSDVVVEHEWRDKLEVSELEWLFLFSIEETDRMEETLSYSWNRIHLIGECSFSKKEMDKMLEPLWDLESKVTEKWSSGWVGVISLLDDKAFLKLRCFLLELRWQTLNPTSFMEKTWSWRQMFLKITQYMG